VRVPLHVLLLTLIIFKLFVLARSASSIFTTFVSRDRVSSFPEKRKRKETIVIGIIIDLARKRSSIHETVTRVCTLLNDNTNSGALITADCLATNRKCRSKISCCCTRQSLNSSGLVASHSNIEILQRFQNRYIIKIIAFWYLTNDTLYHDVPLEMRLKDSADKMQHPNILATNLMKEVKTIL